jgi:SAM-dependent methyltransferase/uncharacterized protein YbaR (Trm112 family)
MPRVCDKIVGRTALQPIQKWSTLVAHPRISELLLADYCLKEFYNYHGLTYDSPTLDHSEVISSSQRYANFKDRLTELLQGHERAIAETLYVMLPAFYAAATTGASDPQVDADIDEYFAGYKSSSAPCWLLRPPLDILQRKFFRQVEHVDPSLELGVGEGYASNFIFKDRLTVGSDPLLFSLLEAQNRSRHESFVALDMTHIPYADESFNTIYLVHTIDHISDRLDALREIGRVLRPGGRVALTDMTAYDRELLPLGHLFDVMGFAEQSQDSFNHFLDVAGERRESYLPDYYYGHLSDLGFTDIRVEPFMAPQLARLVYLQVELQFLLGPHENQVRYNKRLREFYFAQGRRALSSLIAADEELCAGGRALNMFVTARKKGSTTAPAQPVAERLICPECQRGLTNYTCSVCGREYPVVAGMPLLIDFYADHWAKIKDHLPPAYGMNRIKQGLRRSPFLSSLAKQVRHWGRQFS